MQEGYVRIKISDSVARVIFFHPKGNSLPSHLLKDLEQAFLQLSSDTDVRVVVLQSDGEKSFCGGASFEELANLSNFDDAVNFFSGFGRVINSMRKCPKFIVGRVQGKIVGGGLGLAAACDYVVAVNSASIRLSEYSIAIGPFVISYAVERKIGKSAFSQMTIDADWYDAHWAYSKGLYNRIFPSIEEMDKFIDSFVNSLSQRSLEAQNELKNMFWEGTDNWDTLLNEKAKISARLILGEPAQSIVRNLLTKRQ
jgi:methylglutaconyl-CoA hydratase